MEHLGQLIRFATKPYQLANRLRLESRRCAYERDELIARASENIQIRRMAAGNPPASDAAFKGRCLRAIGDLEYGSDVPCPNHLAADQPR